MRDTRARSGERAWPSRKSGTSTAERIFTSKQRIATTARGSRRTCDHSVLQLLAHRGLC